MYTEFYGLSEKPFELTPNPRFLFLTSNHRETIASMREEIRNRRGFISVTGEVGTGKTTLIHFLLSKLESEGKVKTVFISNPTLTFKELLENILLGLNLEPMKASKGTLLRQLNDYLTQMSAKDETLVITIDEAQDLFKEVMGELGMLPKIATLQIIFVGQLEFEDKLNSQGLGQLKQRIVIKHQIRALSEEESRDYINHRLRLVRSSSSERFTPKAISMICSYSKGIPRIINTLCDNAFLRGYILSQTKIDVDIVREVIKDIDGPFLQKTILSPIVTAVKEFRLFPPRLNFLLTKASLVVLSFLCLGGFVFLIDHYFQPRPAKTLDIKSTNSPDVESKPSPIQISPQKIMEDTSKRDASQPPGESEPVSSKPQLISPPPAPLAGIGEEEKLKEMITIEEGQTLYSLTLKYYRTVNETLMDLILDSNPEINDIRLIMVDQKILLPRVTEKLLIIKSADNAYKIHAGTFETPSFGRLYRDARVLKGKRVEILPRKVSSRDTWYRVVIGKFDSEDEVLRMIDILKEKGLLPAFEGGPRLE